MAPARLMALAFALIPIPSVLAEGYLKVALKEDRFEICLEEAPEGPWVLQHSRNGNTWEELAFFDAGREPGDPFVTSIPRGILPQPDAVAGLFRAARFEHHPGLFRRLLDERAKWRLSGDDTYEYQLRQNFGIVFWNGIITVTNDHVTESQTIEQFPMEFDLSPFPTIEDLFDRIVSAIKANAVEINVTWDPVFGFPASCFIDRDRRIADEETSWTVQDFAR